MKPDIDRCSSRSEVVIPAEVYQSLDYPGELQGKEITVRGRTAPIVMRTVKAENLVTLFERATAGSVAAA